MADVAIPEKAFYVAGGNLLPDARSYIVRPADNELFDYICAGHYCYVLTSRQMGKSSLMHRTSVRLAKAGIHPVLLDLTGIGANLSAEQWYFGLLAEMGKQLSLKRELEDYWNSNPQHGPLYRFVHAISDIVLEKVIAPVAIFIDEIDFIRGLKNFSTDEFFAAIRQCFNGRATDPRMQRVTFCLLGVATPADLIRDVHTTPFNIGSQIELADFTKEEAATLSAGLDSDVTTAHRKLDRILRWTGGHPYLTQKLCLSVSERPDCPMEYIDKLCHDMFLATGVRRTEDNLIFVHNTLRNGMDDSMPVLVMYRQVLKGKHVPNDHSDPIVALLRLAGVVRVVNSRLVVRNRIYARVFNKAWVEENMPDADLRRERAAYRRGLIRSGLFFGTISLIIGGFAWAAWHQTILARRESKRALVEKVAAQANETTARNYLYVADMNLAQEALNRHDVQGVIALLEPHKNDPWKSFDWNWLWSSVHGGRQATYQEKGNNVYCSAFSPSGNLLVQGRKDGSIAVWKSPFLKPESILSVATAPIRSVSFTNKGSDLLVLTKVGMVQILNAHNYRLLREWKDEDKISYCIAATSDESVIVVASVSGLQSFNQSGALKAKYNLGPGIGCTSVAISHDNKEVAVGCNDNSARVWNIASGRQILQLRHNGIVQGIAFSPDDRLIATASSDKTAALWDAKTGRRLYTLPHADGVLVAEFSSDGKWLVTGGQDYAIRLWDTKNGKSLNVFEGHDGTILTACFSPNNRFLASAGFGGKTIIWRLGSSDDTVNLSEKPDNPSSYVFSNDGKWVATADTLGTVIVWDAVTGRIVHRFKFLSTIASERVSFSSASDYILIGRVGYRLSAYETAHWTPDPGMPGSGLPISSPYILSPNGRFLATTDRGNLILWDLNLGRAVLSAPYAYAPNPFIAFSPDGTMLATISGTSTITLWSTATLQPVGTFPASKRQTNAGIFSPDGKDLILGSEDGQISCWNVAAKRETVVLPGSETICALGFQSHGKALISITLADKIKTWQADSL